MDISNGSWKGMQYPELVSTVQYKCSLVKMVKGPWKFEVILSQDIDKINNLLQHKKHSPAQNVGVKQPVLINMKGDMFRGLTIEKILPDMWKVMLVDQGSSVIEIKEENILELPKPAIDFPMQSFSCRLQELPSTYNKAICQNFQKLVEDQEFNVTIIKQLQFQVYEVYMECQTFPVNKLLTMAIYDQVPIHSCSHVKISYASKKQGTVYLHKNNVLLWLEEVKKIIDSNSFPQLSLDKTHIGMPCLYCLQMGRVIYRSTILDIIDNKLIKVLCVDYGHEEIVPIDRLRQADHKIIEIPALAAPCVLEGLNASRLNTEEMFKWLNGRQCVAQVFGAADMSIGGIKKKIQKVVLVDQYTKKCLHEHLNKFSPKKVKFSPPERILIGENDVTESPEEEVLVPTKFLKCTVRSWADRDDFTVSLIGTREGDLLKTLLQSVPKIYVARHNIKNNQYYLHDGRSGAKRIRVVCKEDKGIRMELVDFGNVVIGDPGKIMVSPESLGIDKIPPQFITCALIDDVTIDPAKFLREEQLIRFVVKENDKWKVQLKKDEDDDEQNLKSCGNAIQSTSDAPCLEDSKIELPDQPCLSVGQCVYAVYSDNNYTWIRPRDNYLDEIRTIIDSIPKVPLEKYNIGDLCVCQSVDDYLWHRAVITDIKNGAILVEFLDYGNVEWTANTYITSFPEELSSYPAFVYKCIVSEPCVNNTLMYKISEIISCDAKSNAYEIILDANIVENCGLKTVQCDVNREYELTIEHVHSNGQITVHLQEYKESFTELMLSCNELTNCCQILPSPGELCLAFDNASSSWYRALIKDVNQTIYVEYIDYGIIVSLSVENLFEIPEKLRSFPIQAIVCLLYDENTQGLNISKCKEFNKTKLTGVFKRTPELVVDLKYHGDSLSDLVENSDESSTSNCALSTNSEISAYCNEDFFTADIIHVNKNGSVWIKKEMYNSSLALDVTDDMIAVKPVEEKQYIAYHNSKALPCILVNIKQNSFEVVFTSTLEIKEVDVIYDLPVNDIAMCCVLKPPVLHNNFLRRKFKITGQLVEIDNDYVFTKWGVCLTDYYLNYIKATPHRSTPVFMSSSFSSEKLHFDLDTEDTEFPQFNCDIVETEFSELNGDFQETHSAHLNGDLRPTESTHLNGVLSPTESAHFNGDFQPTESTPLNGDLQPTESTHLNGDLQPTESTHLNGDLQPTESTHLNGDLQPTESTHLNGDLQPTESTHLNGDLQPTESTHRKGDLQPTESPHRNGDLQPTESPHRNGDLQPTESPHRNGDLQPTESPHRNGDLQPTESSHRNGDLPPMDSTHLNGKFQLAKSTHHNGALQETNFPQRKDSVEMCRDSRRVENLVHNEDISNILPITNTILEENSHSLEGNEVDHIDNGSVHSDSFGNTSGELLQNLDALISLTSKNENLLGEGAVVTELESLIELAQLQLSHLHISDN